MLMCVNGNVVFLLLSTTYKLADTDRQVGGAQWMYVTETPSDSSSAQGRTSGATVQMFTVLQF